MSFTILVTLYYYLPHNPDDPKEENTVGKGENTGNQHFLLFPSVFSTLSKREIILSIQNCHLQTLWVWDSLKFVIWERVKDGCFT